jgi:hypothetical protein
MIVRVEEGRMRESGDTYQDELLDDLYAAEATNTRLAAEVVALRKTVEALETEKAELLEMLVNRSRPLFPELRKS